MQGDDPSIPRRKALLATASLGSAVTGFSTGALARETKRGDAVAKQPGVGGEPEQPMGKPAGTPDEWLTDDWAFDIPQEVLDDLEPRVYDSETGRAMSNVDARVLNPHEVGTFAERWEKRTANTAEKMGGVDFRATLWEGSAGGYTCKIEGGFKASLASMEAKVDLSVNFNGFVFELISFGITEGDDRLFCVEPPTPKQVPLSISVCPDILWKFGQPQFRFGLTGEACIGIECPVGSCEVCRGIGFDGIIDLEDQEVRLI